MCYIIRKAHSVDHEWLECLYKAVARISGGIARAPDEITSVILIAFLVHPYLRV